MLQSIGVAILVCISLQLSAQTDNDPVYFKYNHFSGREMKDVDARAVYSQLEANVILPGFNLGEKTKVYTNLNYKNSGYDFDEGSTGFFPERLNDIRLGFIVMHKFSGQWQAILAPRLNVRTDFKEQFGKRDLFPSLHLLGIRTSPKNENLSYGLGISYNNEGIKNLVIPLAILQYKTEDIRVYTIIPSFAYFMLTPSEKFEYGLSINLESGLYHVQSFSADDSPNYLSSQNITLAPTLGYRFAGNFWFNFSAGYALPGKYRLLNADFDELPGMEKNSFKSGFSVMAGVSLRVKENSK